MATFNTSTLQLPNELVQGIIDNISYGSVIAKLSPSTPQVFLNSQYTRWSVDPEAEFVAEGAQKSSSEFSTAPVIAAQHKAVTTVRITDEVEIADQDAQLGIVNMVREKLAQAGARALDYGIIHAVSPLTGATVSGMTALKTTANQETATADVLADMDSLPDKIIEAGYVPNGIALASTYANQLRKFRHGADNVLAFPDIKLDPREDSTVGGMTAAVSNTVQGVKVAGGATNLLALAGDYSMVKWGIVRDMGIEVIRYGNPDGLGDLRNTNEIALRLELLYSWAVIDPRAFTALTSVASA